MRVIFGIILFCFIWFASYAELLAATATDDYKRLFVPIFLWAIGLAFLFRKPIGRWLNKPVSKD